MKKSRKGWLAGGGILLLLAAIAGYLMIRKVPIGEMGEILAEGGEKVLREPMRPARGETRVLVFALDGVGDDELRQAVVGGGAPRIAALLGAQQDSSGIYEHAYAAEDVLSVLPSTTLAAWSSLFTGRSPAETGIPGNEWFVREEARFYAPGPVSVTGTEDAARVYSDDLLGGALRVPTLYELADLRSYVSLSQLHRGADLLTIPDAGLFGEVIGAVAAGITDDDEVKRDAYAEVDEAAATSLIESIRTHGVADLQVVYFPGVDLYTHIAKNPLEDQRAYLREIVDPAVGAILDEYRARGAANDTYVMFVADHGHTPVLADDLHSLGVDGTDEPTALIEAAGFRMRPAKLELDDGEEDFQAVVAYQGAIAFIYLADRSTCQEDGARCAWSSPPRLEGDVLPLVRAFDAANRSGAGLPELRGALDLILARGAGSPDGRYQVWDGQALVPLQTYLAQNPRPDLLDFERRIEGLTVGPYGNRAGDILLLTRSGTQVPIEQRYYFSGEYRSWHGSPGAQDSRIPLLVAHPGKPGSEIRTELLEAIGASASQTDITPLILNLLGKGSG